MPEAVYHQMIMLRPMQAGISGFARVQGEAGRQLVQINLRGIQGSMRAFWYAGDGLVRELGRCTANARGEAGLYTDLPDETVAPRRLTALLLLDGSDKPRPLAIGLCTAQSAGSLMDARNALLALCDRLGRMEEHPPKADVLKGNPDRISPAPAAAATLLSEPAGHRRGEAPGSGLAQAERASEAHKAELPSATPKSGSGAPPAESGSAAPKGPSAPTGGEPIPRSAKGTDATGGNRRRKEADQSPPREVFLPAIDVCRERRRRKQPTPSANTACVQPEAGSGQGACTEGGPAETGGCSAVAGSTAGDTFGAAGGTAAVPGCIPAAGAVPESSPAEKTLLCPAPARRSPSARPADRLPPLCWPEALRPLADCFDRCPPAPLMNWPGWRFVQVQKGENGLWIGRERRAGSITRVAYILPADAEIPEGKPFRQARTAAGDPVQVLVMRG